jgi:serine/threonine protein kinase
MFESLTLANLLEKQRGILRRPSSTRPTIWIVEENGFKAVVKDFSSNGFIFRNTLGRFLIWRETKAYRKLESVNGIPALYRNINGLALVLEKISGNDLGKIKKGNKLPDGFMVGLKTLVDEFHALGVAHCDLKRKVNVILGNDGRPYIIDWGACIFQNEFKFPFLRAIYRRFLLDDHMAVIKIKLRYEPNMVSEEERHRYYSRSIAERIIRYARDRLRNMLQKIA